MQKEHILINEIISEHRERMLNLKKYYPFFKLSETSFSWYKDGAYDNLDMGYILMAVLRFFIEENNFKERDVTYADYVNFMKKCLRRDFGIIPDEADEKVLTDYIFDKLKNDGRPFTFEYYDPVDREKKVSRVRLLESRIQDGTVWYSISPDGIEFYLDTKEIRDESRISVEQLLLEKMIRSRDFKGGAEVVRRINSEVERLRYRKTRVVDMLTTDVFAGVEAYKEFFDTGIKWFDEEQKLFIKNRELIEAALKRAESEKTSGDSSLYYKTANEIYRLDTELKVAMNNHSELLRACTELGITADEIIKKSKLSRLRSRFNFRSILNTMQEKDDYGILQYVVKPFMGLNIRKTFDFKKTEAMLEYRPENREQAERAVKEKITEIVFEDEEAEKLFRKNCRTLFLILFSELKKHGKIKISEYHRKVTELFSDEITKNGDYYAFLVHLCGKSEYVLSDNGMTEETFLDSMIKEFMAEREFQDYLGMKFYLELAEGSEEEIITGKDTSITDFFIILREKE